MDKEKTKVIFRMWQGEVIAIFPELAGDMNPGTCSSYQHIGQHGACDPYMIINSSKLAKPEEYADLKAELENNVGYNLDVIKRNRYSFYRSRLEQLRRIA